MSAAVTPIVAAKTQRTCDELGIPCLTCTRTDAPALHPDDYIECTSMETISILALIAVFAVISLALMAGGVVFVISHLWP